MHNPTDRIAHTTAFVTPVVGHWLEREIAQWTHPMKDRSNDPSHHERTLLPRSYISQLSVEYCIMRTPKSQEHKRAVEVHDASLSNRATAKHTGWHHSTISILFTRLQQTALWKQTFQPVLHDWCNKGRGMCYPVGWCI